MVDIRPFRGLQYNPDHAGHLSEVICPPYDIISHEEQQSFYRNSPYNVIRLELGEEFPSDSPQNNRYTRSAGLLNDWLEEQILVQDETPAFYVTEHRFVHRDRPKNRWDVTTALRLEDWSTGKIRPHEDILKTPAEDRLNLLRACAVNISPVLGMLCFEDRELSSMLAKLVEGKEASRSVVDNYNAEHSMWILNDEASIHNLSELCSDKALYIIDGHHRYTTSLDYQKEQNINYGASDTRRGADFIMMNLTDADDPGLLMLPTHRLIRLSLKNIPETRVRLEEVFHITRLQRFGSTPSDVLETWLNVMEEEGKKQRVIGVYGLYDDNFCLLFPRNENSLMGRLPVERSEAWKKLDVSVLHWVVLQGVMGINTPIDEGGSVTFTRDALEAVEQVDVGNYELAFILNPMPSSDIISVADVSDRMPQKSTYFYPKPPTGLVMNPLWCNSL